MGHRAAASHHGHLGQGLRHGGGHVGPRGGGHPRGRQRVAGGRGRALARPGGWGDGLRGLGFVDFWRFRRRGRSRSTQLSTIYVVSQRSSKALNTRQVFLGFASRLLFKLIGRHPLLINQDTLSFGARLVFGDIKMSCH